MARLLTTLLLTFSLCGSSVAEDFVCGVYWPWERTAPLAELAGKTKWQFAEARLADLQKDELNAVWVANLSPDDLPELAARCLVHGIRLIPALDTLHYGVPWRRNNWSYLEAETRRAICCPRCLPAVLAWCICDEPAADQALELETYRTLFGKWGAVQPAIVVTTWSATPAYTKTGFETTCMAVYGFFSPNNPNGPSTPERSRAWYTAQVKAAVAGGKPTWIMPQYFANPQGPWRYNGSGNAVLLPGAVLHQRMPTADECRWQVEAAVAAGAMGVVGYVYLPPVSDAPTAPASEPAALRVKRATGLNSPGAMLRRNGGRTNEYRAFVEACRAAREVKP